MRKSVKTLRCGLPRHAEWVLEHTRVVKVAGPKWCDRLVNVQKAVRESDIVELSRRSVDWIAQSMMGVGMKRVSDDSRLPVIEEAELLGHKQEGFCSDWLAAVNKVPVLCTRGWRVPVGPPDSEDACGKVVCSVLFD